MSTFRTHSRVLPIAGMLCILFCIYLDNAKINLTRRLANMGLKALQPIRLSYQDASFSSGREQLAFFKLWPDRFLFHYMQPTGEALVKQRIKASISPPLTIVDYNNNIHSG